MHGETLKKVRTYFTVCRWFLNFFSIIRQYC